MTRLGLILTVLAVLALGGLCLFVAIPALGWFDDPDLDGYNNIVDRCDTDPGTVDGCPPELAGGPFAPTYPTPSCPGCTPQAGYTPQPGITPQVTPGAGAWEGDNFGPEVPLPGNFSGPAIAELYNSSTGFCALVRINTGESLDWRFAGAYWQAGSDAALKARWPHHQEEYLAHYPNCQSLLSVTNVTAQVP